MLAIGMIACERPGFPLERSISLLRAGGFTDEQITVFAEPGMTYPSEAMPGVVIVQNECTLGVNRNARQCFESMVNSGAEHLLIVENDVGYRPQAASTLREMLSRHYGYISLYTPELYLPFIEHLGEGWVEFNRGWSNSAGQSCCFHIDAARKLMRDPRWPFLGWSNVGNADTLIGTFFEEHKELPGYYHVPSLADHIGFVSSRHDLPPADGHRGLGFHYLDDSPEDCA